MAWMSLETKTRSVGIQIRIPCDISNEHLGFLKLDTEQGLKQTRA